MVPAAGCGFRTETKDPVLLHAPTRRSVGYFGEVRLRDGRFQFCREADRFKGATFFAFMKSLRRTSIRTGRRVVVITDNARYHHARLHQEWREEHAEDFALDYLPPYSPELNPIERVWKLTRRRYLHNRYFPDLDNVVAAVEVEFDQWTIRNETLRRLLEKQALAEDNSRLRETVKTQEEFGGLIGKAEKMASVYQFIEMVAPTGATVLIQGESGVGKELIARAIHQRSARSHGPLISLNCGAIPESLLESELFGFEKGAFTGADAARQGKSEMSDKGTLFLDEVGEMNPKTQIELLRVIETKELRRLGGSKLISVDLRVVAATNKKLSDEVAAGKFREDLFYRLNVVPIFVPPLRDRREDIRLLAERFLREFAARYQKPRKRFARDVIELLMGLPWPGNVRELRNLMERLTVTVSDAIVGMEDLPEEYRPASISQLMMEIPIGQPLDKVEEMVIRKTLNEVTSHRGKAARILGISPRALHYKLRRYGIGDEDAPTPAA
jgi:transcriptional regulator with GAF, ATPase, and Fis domain